MKKINLDASRVYRGSRWYYSASYLRAAYRYYNSPSIQRYSVGLRFVRGKNE